MVLIKLCVHVQFVFDGRLESNESFRTWRNEETDVGDAALSVEIAILWQILQVGVALCCRYGVLL